MRTIFSAVCDEVGAVCRGSRPITSFCPQRELPLARLVIHRTDLCQHNVGNAEGCSRGRDSVLLPPATLAAGNGRSPHYQRTQRGGFCLGGGRHSPVRRVSARNHSALEHIDFVIGHGRSGVPLLSTRLRQ